LPRIYLGHLSDYPPRRHPTFAALAALHPLESVSELNAEKFEAAQALGFQLLNFTSAVIMGKWSGLLTLMALDRRRLIFRPEF
jgi:hypothetical protein